MADKGTTDREAAQSPSFEIHGPGNSKQPFANFPDAMQAFAKLERQHDHALTMQKGGKTAVLATTDWQNDGSTPVATNCKAKSEQHKPMWPLGLGQ